MEPKFVAVSFAGYSRGGPEALVRYRAGSTLGMLAEGQGSFSGGGLAAELSVDLLPLALSAPTQEAPLQRWNAAADRVHEAVRRASSVDPFYRGMTAMFAAAHFDGTHIVIGSVGESRVYRLRGTDFARITKPPPENAPAVGGEGNLELSLMRFSPADGDVVLLVTARVYRSIHEGLIREILIQERAEPEVAAREIANSSSGENVAVVVGRVETKAGRRGTSDAAIILE